ncbi:MAG: hypothetical protein ACRCZH_00830 [Cetobacterium sp.]
MLDRYKKIKTEVIDKLVAEDKHCENYTLCTIQDRMDMITNADSINDLQSEITTLEEKLKELEIYQYLQFKKMLLKSKLELREVSEKLVLEYMIANNIKETEWYGYKLEVQNRKSVETEVEFFSQIPEEYIRTTKVLNKIEAKRMYTETGVLIPGVKFIHKDNYSLKIKEGK